MNSYTCGYCKKYVESQEEHPSYPHTLDHARNYREQKKNVHLHHVDMQVQAQLVPLQDRLLDLEF